MISLSKILKASMYTSSDERLRLALKSISISQTKEMEERLQDSHPLVEEASAKADEIIRDAEEKARIRLEEAIRQIEEQKRKAEEEIQEWWREKEAEWEARAQQLWEETRSAAYEEGYAEGIRIARQEQEEQIAFARDLLMKATLTKQNIIAEAEPLLISLSVEIARKIIGDEIQTTPEKVAEIVKRALSRSRPHGEITICVNPRHYDTVAEQRSQWLALLEGQAELIIVPDYSIHDEGCVIRTAYGSIDARIDTQLSEIRQALTEIARGSGDYGSST